MMFPAGAPPRIIAFTAERIFLPGNLPAADVLGTGRDAQRFRRVRIETWQAFRHPLRIDEFARTGPASDDVLSWIMRVGLVDLCDHGL